MKLPLRVKDIINALYTTHRSLAEGDDDQRRALTLKIAQQCRHELGPQWGTKRADPTRPPSKDAIAHFDGATLLIWDWQDGTTRAPGDLDADGKDVSEQVFIAVDPINHLAVVPMPNAGTTLPNPGTKCGDKIAALQGVIESLVKETARSNGALADIEQRLERLHDDLGIVRTKLDKPHPPLRGGNWRTGSITLEPQA